MWKHIKIRKEGAEGGEEEEGEYLEERKRRERERSAVAPGTDFR